LAALDAAVWVDHSPAPALTVDAARHAVAASLRDGVLDHARRFTYASPNTRHGGRIAVESGPGRGSRCDIDLPAAPAAPESDAPTAGDRARAALIFADLWLNP
jgi:hypothetical protein